MRLLPVLLLFGWEISGKFVVAQDNNPEYVCNVKDLVHGTTIPSKEDSLKTPGFATTWLIKTVEFPIFYSLEFIMWPFTTCQTVQLCSGSISNIDCSPQKSIVYDTLQQTMLVNGKTYLYHLPKVTLTVVNNGTGLYSYNYFTSMDGSATKTMNGTIQLSDNITILTSSASCNIYVNRVNGPKVDHVIHTKSPHSSDSEYKSIHGSGLNTKTYNGLLVNATMSQAVAGPSSSCDHIFDMEDQNTDSESHVSEKQDQPVFTAYKFAPNSKPGCSLKNISSGFKSSFNLVMEEPQLCKWVRLCFSDKDTGAVCREPNKNLDMLPLMRIYVPTDTNNAQNFALHTSDLRRFSFRFFDPSTVPNSVVMRMAYGSGSDDQLNVFENMLLPVDFSKTVTVYLGHSAGCSARVEETAQDIMGDIFGGTAGPTVVQCLTISHCQNLLYKP